MAFPADIPVCDPHFHVWDRTVFYNKNLGDIADGDLGIYTGERYCKEAAGFNLKGALHVETVVGQKPGGFAIDTVAETKYVVEQSKAFGSRPCGIVAYVHLAREDAAAVLDGHAAAGGSAFVGVRQIMNWRDDGQLCWPQVEHGKYFDGTSPESLAFARGLSLLSARGLTYDLHLNWFQASAAAAFLDAHAPKDLKVIIDHVGCLKLGRDVGEDSDESRLAVWKAGMAALAARPNTFMKVSGIEYVYPGWMDTASQANKDALALVKYLLEVFGPDRLLFASNYPVDKAMAPKRTDGSWTDLNDLYSAAYGLTQELGLSKDQTEAFFCGNTWRVYGMDRVKPTRLRMRVAECLEACTQAGAALDGARPVVLTTDDCGEASGTATCPTGWWGMATVKEGL